MPPVRLRVLDDVDVSRPARRRSFAGKAKTRRDADRGHHLHRRGAQYEGQDHARAFGLGPRGFGATDGFQLNAFIAQRPFVCLVFVLMTRLDLCGCGGVLRACLVAS